MEDLSPQGRLLKAEETLLTYRTRFRLMALGYLILAIGFCVTIYFLVRVIDDVQDTQVKTVQLVGKSEGFDCVRHNMLRRDLEVAGVAVPQGDKCSAIHQKFKRLEEQAAADTSIVP